jgi:predicted outer membrane protein
MSSFRPYLLSTVLLCAAGLMPASSVSAGPKTGPPERATNTAPAPMTDAQSLGVVEAGSSGEVEVANTAKSRARSEVVLRLAQATINDHTEAVQVTRALAEKLHVRTAPSAASSGLRKEADDLTSHLENVPPSNFDRAYLEGTIRFHQKVLSAIDETVPSTNAPEVQALFADVRARVDRELTASRNVLASRSVFALR